METDQNIEQLLDAKGVRKLLRCSLPWVYKAAEQGVLPCIRIPCPGERDKRAKSMVRFKREDIVEFIERHYSSS